MTDKPDLDAIEARRNTALATSNEARRPSCLRHVLEEDIPALIAELRKAWEDNETLLREHNHALAVIREAS